MRARGLFVQVAKCLAAHLRGEMLSPYTKWILVPLPPPSGISRGVISTTGEEKIVHAKHADPNSWTSCLAAGLSMH